MIWREVFEQALQNDNDYVLKFFEPVLPAQIDEIVSKARAGIPRDLLELLRQTNGVYNDRFNEFIVYDSDKILKAFANHLEYLQTIGCDCQENLLFFSDNGCGELFGYRLSDDGLDAKQIGVYYPITNEFRIVCSDLLTWFRDWFSGNLGT